MDDTLPGPDGFLVEVSDPLRAAQMSLSNYLMATEHREMTREDMQRWKKLPKRQGIDHIEAILRRLAWLHAHDRELSTPHQSRRRLTQLLRVFYTMKLPCTETDLRMMLDLTTPLLEHIAPDGPVDYVTTYLEQNDLTPELCHSLRDFKAHVRTDVSGVASLQSLLQRLHMLLWLDEWEPLDPTRCWSECVRRDFRAMTGERRTNWRRLLKHLRGNAPVHMPAGWAREAEPRLALVGVEDFREQLGLWFAPFRSGEPLPLSVAGSHVLKGLVWYAALTRDAEVKEYALWLLDVRWKQKRNADKSVLALEVFGVTKEQLTERGLLNRERAVKDPFQRILETVSAVIRSNPASRMAASDDEDLIVIQGDLHFYRLFRSTHRIERATDNKLLELDWHALPDHMRDVTGPQCDSEEQLRMRGYLLMHDSVFGRYFRTPGSASS